MRVFNKFGLSIGSKTKLDTVNFCILRGLQEGTDTYIDEDEINMVKSRRVTDKESILVNGRITGEQRTIFTFLQAEYNLNQRQLLYILVKRISERWGFNI